MTKEYSLDDLNPMTYDEYATAVARLTGKLRTYCIMREVRFDIIVPILRSGAIPAGIIAHHLDIQHFLPVQVYHEGRGLKQVFTMPRMLDLSLTAPNILICDNHTVSGAVARRSIELVRESVPDSKICFSSVVTAYGGPASFEHVEECFFGVQSNELCAASP